LETSLSDVADLGLDYKDKVLMSDGAFILQPGAERGRIFFIGHVANWRKVRQDEARPIRGVIVGFADDKPDQAIWSAFPEGTSLDNVSLDDLEPRWVYLRDLVPDYVTTTTGQTVAKTLITRQQLLELASLLAPGGTTMPAPSAAPIDLTADASAGRALRPRSPKVVRSKHEVALTIFYRLPLSPRPSSSRRRASNLLSPSLSPWAMLPKLQ
jgi:hypothetical protein